jgi:NTE family protein
LSYRSRAFSGHSEDYEFELDAMRELWQSGLDDMRHTRADSYHLDWSTPELGIVTHDIYHEEDRS